jgi:hypothetical protein
VSDVRRLEALEQVNARLQKLAAERALEIEGMKEIAAKKMVVVSSQWRCVCRGSEVSRHDGSARCYEWRARHWAIEAARLPPMPR